MRSVLTLRARLVAARHVLARLRPGRREDQRALAFVEAMRATRQDELPTGPLHAVRVGGPATYPLPAARILPTVARTDTAWLPRIVLTAGGPA